MAYGALVFMASFMIRVHGLTVAEAGSLFGVMSAVTAVIGSLGGGKLTDRLAQRDIAWVAKLPGVGLVIAVPLYIGCFYSGSLFLMVLFEFLGGILLAGAIPAAFAAKRLVFGAATWWVAVAGAFFLLKLIVLLTTDR